MYITPWAVVLILVLAVLVWAFVYLGQRYRVARIPLFLLPLAIAALIAWSALMAPHGYAAAYSFGAIWMLSIALFVASALLLPMARSRRAGLIGIVAAVAMLVLFYAIYGVGFGLGYYRWKNVRQVKVGPEVRADVVIFFKPGTTDDQIEQFQKILFDESPAAEQSMCTYLRVRGFQTQHGLEGISASFCPDTSTDRRRQIIAAVEHSPLVYTLARNAAPSEVTIGGRK